MNEELMGDEHATQPFAARTIRRFSVLIILGWVALVVVLAFAVPSLEQVAKAHSQPLNLNEAPSVKAMTRMSRDFKESSTESVLMIVLEGQQPLGDDAHRYYDSLIHQFQGDSQHVRHIQNFWGDPLTAGAAQSADGKAAYVQLNLAGNAGHDPGERIDRSRPENRSASTTAARNQGLRHRSRCNRCGYEH